MGLEDVFNEEPQEAVVTPAESPAESPAEEPAKEPEKGEEETAPPAEEAKEPVKPAEGLEEWKRKAEAFQRKSEDEVRKRQEYETRLRQIEEEKQKEPPPDVWEDPEKYIGKVKQDLEQSFNTRILQMSEAGARTRHEDFDEKLVVFQELVQESPELLSHMLNSADPAEYAYKQAEKVIAFKEMGDPASYRQRIEAEVRSKLEKEFAEKQKNEIEEAIKKRLPPGFSESQSKGNPDKEAFAGPAPLKSILG
jgi:hypothetical protein